MTAEPRLASPRALGQNRRSDRRRNPPGMEATIRIERVDVSDGTESTSCGSARQVRSCRSAPRPAAFMMLTC